MTRITPSLFLLCAVLTLGGCKDQAGVQQNHGGGVADRPSRASEDNRAYETEAQRRRYRGEDSGVADRERPSEDRERRRHHSRAMSSTPGHFDFYLLNLSWSPEYCHAHPAANECAQHRGFTLHGLWPQNADGTYPEECSDDPGPADPSAYVALYPDPALLQHEWRTHGTCSGLGADRFFSLARQAEQSIHIPAELAHVSDPITLTPGQVETMFTSANPSLPASSLALSCGNNYLTAVEVCLGKDLKAVSCNAVKSCRATSVRIAPQG